MSYVGHRIRILCVTVIADCIAAARNERIASWRRKEISAMSGIFMGHVIVDFCLSGRRRDARGITSTSCPRRNYDDANLQTELPRHWLPDGAAQFGVQRCVKRRTINKGDRVCRIVSACDWRS